MKKNKLAIAITVVVIIAGILAFGGFGGKAETAVLTGTVSYRERIALPGGSRIEVEIRDVSRADAPAETIASTVIITEGENVPIPFTIEYAPEKINPSMTYSVFARIFMGEDLRWITSDHVSFLEEGVPVQNVELVLTAARTSAPTTPSAPVAPATLDGKNYRLVSFNGVSVPQNENYTLSFGQGTISAKFCNNMSGSYIVSGVTIKASPLISTLMYCASPSGLMNMETAFGTMLDSGATFVAAGNTLMISAGTNTMMFAAAQ